MCLLDNVVVNDCLDFVGYSAKHNWRYVSASQVRPHTAIINLRKKKQKQCQAPLLKESNKNDK